MGSMSSRISSVVEKAKYKLADVLNFVKLHIPENMTIPTFSHVAMKIRISINIIIGYIFIRAIAFLSWFVSIFRSTIYDYTMGRFYTKYLMKETFDNFPDNAQILDVGPGTGYVYKLNQETIRKKNLKIVGIDIDHDYIKQAKLLIKSEKLDNNITLINKDVCKFEDPETEQDKFDYVLFSDSYALIPNVFDVMRNCERFLKSGGKIIVVSTLFEKQRPIVRWIKQRAHKITTMHFGDIMLKKDLFDFARTRSVTTAHTRVRVPFIDYLLGSYIVQWTPKSNENTEIVETVTTEATEKLEDEQKM